MTKDEALKLALEALEAAYARIVTKCEQNLVTYNGVDVDTLTLSQEAITAIKEALAQPEHDYKDLYEKEKRRSAMWLSKYEEVAGPAPKAIPMAQPEQEPVACKECHLKDTVYDLLGDLKVANLKLSVRGKRTLIGLTDEEREQVINANTSTGLWHMAKDIEAKLKEKNS